MRQVVSGVTEGDDATRIIGLDLRDLLRLLRTVALSRADLVEPLLVVAVREREDTLRARLPEPSRDELADLTVARYHLALGDTATSARAAAEADLCAPWLWVLLNEFATYLHADGEEGGLVFPGPGDLVALSQMADALRSHDEATA